MQGVGRSLPRDGIPTRIFWPLLAVVYAVCRLGTWGYPFDSDQWIFYYVGHDWLHGGSLYVTAFDHKPPLVFLFNGLMSLALGGNIALQRALFTVLSFVDIYLFYRLCRKVAPRLVASSPVLFTQVALVIYVFWRDLSQFASSANNTENLGVIFVSGMLLAFLSFRDSGGIWKLLAAGVCLSFLFFLKPNFLLLGLPVGILLIAAYRRQPARLVGYAVLYVLPVLIQTVIWLAYFASKGALHDFMLASFLFSSKYAGSAWAGDVSSTSVRLISIGTLLLLLLPVLALGFVYARDPEARRGGEVYWLIGLSVIASLGLTLDVGAFYAYYFLIALPAFAIVMACGLLGLRRLQFDVRNLVALGVAACMLVSLGYSMKQLVNSFAGSVHADALEYQSIAAYVDANSSPSDRVFDYDYGATFYQLSGRRSGSRFVSASLLLLDYRDHYGFNLDGVFIKDMDAARTKFVIVPRSTSNIYYENKPLIAYFDSHYALAKAFPDYSVLVRKGT